MRACVRTECLYMGCIAAIAYIQIDQTQPSIYGSEYDTCAYPCTLKGNEIKKRIRNSKICEKIFLLNAMDNQWSTPVQTHEWRCLCHHCPTIVFVVVFLMGHHEDSPNLLWDLILVILLKFVLSSDVLSLREQLVLGHVVICLLPCMYLGISIPDLGTLLLMV